METVIMEQAEMKELMQTCYQTRTDVAVLNANHNSTRFMIEEMRKQIIALSDELKQKSDNAYKGWHFVALTIAYSVISLAPHSQLFDFLFK